MRCVKQVVFATQQNLQKFLRMSSFCNSDNGKIWKLVATDDVFMLVRYEFDSDCINALKSRFGYKMKVL